MIQLSQRLGLVLIFFAVITMDAKGELFDRWSIVHTEGLSLKLYNKEIDESWAALTIGSFREENHRFGHFHFRMSPKMVMQNLQIEIDLTKMGDHSLSEITQKINKIVGDLRMKYEGVSVSIKSEAGTLVIHSNTLDDAERDGTYSIVLKGDVKIDGVGDAVDSAKELYIYKDLKTKELVIEYV